MFELRRGDDDSAPPEDLLFTVKVRRTESDMIDLHLDFENPEQVSIGSKKDMLVIEVADYKFFSRTDEPSHI